MATTKTKLAMEDYLDFIEDRSRDLTASQLAQSLLIDMVSTMDLMDLRRSTLLDGGVSGDAHLTLEEAIKDLKHLDWQECHVTSLMTQGASLPYSATAAASVKRKRAKRSSKKPIKSGAGDSAGITIAAKSTKEDLVYPGGPLSRKSPCNRTHSVTPAFEETLKVSEF